MKTINNKIHFFGHNCFAKRCSFFPSQLSCFPFLASLEQKRNTFCENWNVAFYQITYHILQITVYWTIASKFNQFQNNNSHFLSSHVQNSEMFKGVQDVLDVQDSCIIYYIISNKQSLFWINYHAFCVIRSMFVYNPLIELF